MLRSTLSALVRPDGDGEEPVPNDDADDASPTSPGESRVVSSTTMMKNTVPMAHPPLMDLPPLSEQSPRALRPHELTEWRQRLGFV
jgi:hypothetical protein